jgi:hypothetical protein
MGQAVIEIQIHFSDMGSNRIDNFAGVVKIIGYDNLQTL